MTRIGSVNWSRLACLSLFLGTFLAANMACADEQHLIKVHKQSYQLELFEDGNVGPLKVYSIAVAKNSGDKRMPGTTEHRHHGDPLLPFQQSIMVPELALLRQRFPLL